MIPWQINSASGQMRASPPTDRWVWICWCSSMRYNSFFSTSFCPAVIFWSFDYTSIGHILWDWQQERELWEKEAALLHAPAGCSRWCKVSHLNICWKSIHQRGGGKNQRLDGAIASLKRWEGCFVNCTIKLWWYWLFTHFQGYYGTSVTMGCLPISSFYFTESGSFLFRLVSLMYIRLMFHLVVLKAKITYSCAIFACLSRSVLEIENEIKDPDLLVVPPICLGQPLEETPAGIVNSFLNEFM